MTEGYAIRRYEADGITIGEQRFERSLLLAPDQIDTTWGPDAPTQLKRAHLEQIIALSPEIVIIGSGKNRVNWHTSEQQQWLQLFPGMEIMTTDAACRTYNLLLSQGRRVVAGLILETEQTPQRTVSSE